MATRYSDSFVEWDALDTEGSVLGELVMRWQMQNDWSVWDYEVGDHSGYIKQKFSDDPTQWEVRGDGRVVTMRTLWSDDFSEWRVSDNQTTLVLKSRYGNSAEEWMLRDESQGHFYMYTSYENDPRDWTIESDLPEEISMPMRMALIFLVLYHSCPKE